MKNHMDLDVWQKAMQLVEDIYKIGTDFPKEEIYGLTSQMRRAAVSIPSNIAEGAARQGYKEFIQFPYISLGSLSEIETHLILAERLKYTSDITRILQEITTIKKMISGLINHQKNKI